MAYQQCRFCLVAVNGYIKLMEHERQSHPKLYWQAKADSCRKQAELLLKEADAYDLCRDMSAPYAGY